MCVFMCTWSVSGYGCYSVCWGMGGMPAMSAVCMVYWVELAVCGTYRYGHTNRTHVCLWALCVPLHVNACPSQRL